MRKENLNNFIKGWFVGHFTPTIIDSDRMEVAIKRYKAGDYEKSHYHAIAIELTAIVSGEVEMNGVKYNQDDIIVINPGEVTDFRCLTDVVTVVVKSPSIENDKFLVP